MNNTIGYLIVIAIIIISYWYIYKYYLGKKTFCKKCGSIIKRQGFDDYNQKLVCPTCKK